MGVRRITIRAWAFGVLAFLALAIGAYALVMYGTPDHLHKQSFVTGKSRLPDLWYNILWAHAISAGVALAIGWLQFIKKLRHHAPNIHRLIGYLYSTMITIGGLNWPVLSFLCEWRLVRTTWLRIAVSPMALHTLPQFKEHHRRSR